MYRNPVVITCVGAVVCIGLTVLSGMATLLTWLETCSGDGGYPYSAPGSVAGRFCDSSFSAPVFVAELAIPILCALGFSVWAVTRRSLGLVGAGLGVAPLAIVVLGGVVNSLPDSCSDEQGRSDPYNC